MRVSPKKTKCIFFGGGGGGWGGGGGGGWEGVGGGGGAHNKRLLKYIGVYIGSPFWRNYRLRGT